jgi:hypothetical protein
MNINIVVIVCVFLLFCVGSITAKRDKGPLPSASYGELAAYAVVPDFKAFVAGLVNFNSSSEPGHVKQTRGPLADARTSLDIFAYAYPPSTSLVKRDDGTDVYLLLIADLTVGHNILGDYSDLGGVKYTPKEKQAMLAKCLAWKATYLADDAKYNFVSFVSNPSQTEMFDRPKANLSGHFWGHVPGVPMANLTGLQNIAILQEGELNQIIAQYTVFSNYTDIWKESVHKDFHNYRKDLRYCHQTYSGFKGIYQDAAKAKNAIGMVDAAEHNLGPINNRIEDYFFYHANGPKKTAEKLKTEIKTLWAAELKRLAKENFLSVVQASVQNLIPH